MLDTSSLPQNGAIVGAPLLRALVEVVERFGVTRAVLFDAAKLDERRLDQHFARFSSQEFDRLQCASMDLTGKETLGILLAKASDGAFGVAAHVVAHAPSLREALRASAKFGATLHQGNRLEIVERVDQAQLRYVFARTSARSDRMFAEFVVAGFMRLLRLCARGQPLGATAYFEHTAPLDCSDHFAELGDSVYFGQSFTGLTFQRELLDAAPIHHQPELHDVLYSEAESLLERVTGCPRLADRLRSYLMTFTPSELPTMDEVARVFGTSPRSLRRRLADEGVSYRALTRSLLETSATRSLRHERGPLKQVAEALGFSDPSAFNRAFKRWTGVTPAAFRRP
jgi:AraC-like DNA-binding protein